MSQSVKLQVIVGSTRQNRFSEKPARWIFEQARGREGVEAELLDLRDYPLPFYDEPSPPTRLKGQYSSEVAGRWVAKVAEADGYIIVSPEYNHGYPAVLKNALDYAYREWNRKAVGFVSYGGVSGARAVEQLRQVVIELEMAPIRNSVHLPVEVFREALGGKAEAFEASKKQAEGFWTSSCGGRARSRRPASSRARRQRTGVSGWHVDFRVQAGGSSLGVKSVRERMALFGMVSRELTGRLRQPAGPPGGQARLPGGGGTSFLVPSGGLGAQAAVRCM